MVVETKQLTLALPKQKPKAKKPPTQPGDYWSPGGQIFFCDGIAYGVSKDGATICLGNRDKVEKSLDGQQAAGNKIIDNIIRQDFINRGNVNLAPRTMMRRRRIRK